LFKSTNIKWSQEFDLNQLPLQLSDSADSPDAHGVKLLEEKIDKLDLIRSHAFVTDQQTTEDLGVCVERTVRKDKDFVKWRRALLKKCHQAVRAVFGDSYEERLDKKLRVRIGRFLHEKAALVDYEKYNRFLQETVKKTSLLKRDVIFQNCSMSGKSQKAVVRQIKTAIDLFLNKE